MTSSTVDNRGYASGVGALALNFELTTPQIADFNIRFSGDTSDSHTAVNSVVLFYTLTKPMVQIPARSVPFGFHHTYLLKPGVHFLQIQADALAFFGRFGDPGPGSTRMAHSGFSFALNLTDPAPVPEPTSIVLLGSGLVGLLGLRGRRS